MAAKPKPTTSKSYQVDESALDQLEFKTLLNFCKENPLFDLFLSQNHKKVSKEECKKFLLLTFELLGKYFSLNQKA